MSEAVYEVVAQVMRYWFAVLSLLIVWRSFRWLRRDRRARHRLLRSLPDAGMVGEWVVRSGSKELPEGVAVPVPREGVLGDIRSDDICIPVGGVAHRHLYFDFVPKKGLRIEPAYRQICTVNDSPVTWRSVRKKPVYLHHGDVVRVGDAVLFLRIFMGLEKEYRPAYADDDANAAPPDADAPMSPVQPAIPAQPYVPVQPGMSVQPGTPARQPVFFPPVSPDPVVSEEDALYAAPRVDPSPVPPPDPLYAPVPVDDPSPRRRRRKEAR